jgi:CheY-like chemotaxis protein
MSTSELFRYPLVVLVVDDSADTAESLAELLGLQGHRVSVAFDGASALRCAADQPPDVVLLDLRMPGLDGCQVAKAIREQCVGRGKRPFLVAVTGCGTDEDRTRSREAGFDLHLVKPVDPAMLTGLMERYRRLLAPAKPPEDMPSDEDPPDARFRAARYSGLRIRGTDEPPATSFTHLRNRQ